MAVMRAGRFAEHFLGDEADGVAVLQDAVGALLDGDDAGLVEDDALALDANEGVAGSQVDAHVDAEHAQQGIKDHADTPCLDRAGPESPGADPRSCCLTVVRAVFLCVAEAMSLLDPSSLKAGLKYMGWANAANFTECAGLRCETAL